MEGCDIPRMAVGVLLAAVIALGWFLAFWNLRFDLRDGKFDGQHCECPHCNEQKE